MTLAVALLIGAGVFTAGYQGAKTYYRTTTQKNYNDYKQAVEDNHLGSLTTREVIEDLWSAGVIDEQTHKNSIKQIETLEKIYGSKLNETMWDRLWKSPDFYIEGGELYKTLATYAPYLSGGTAKSYDELVNAVNNSFYTNLPKTQDAPTPQYLDAKFEGTQIEVTDPRYWSASELAELHNINYDPNYYYDLIKQGTSANVKAGQFTNRQLEALANSQDTKSVTGYLDSIRNARAEALANGATMGARAAAEVLANTETINAQAATQAQLANTKSQNMSDLLLADAQAGLTARQYFDQLAQALSTDAVTNYAYDVDRYSQELLTNAELYTADQNLRGERLKANADMYAAYLDAQGAINAANSAITADSDQFAWFFNNALKAYDNDVAKAFHATNDAIYRTYNNQTRTDYINSILN